MLVSGGHLLLAECLLQQDDIRLIEKKIISRTRSQAVTEACI